MSQMSLSGECVFSITTKKKGYFDGFILCVLILLTHIYFRSKKQKDAVFMSAQRTFKINDRGRENGTYLHVCLVCMRKALLFTPA